MRGTVPEHKAFSSRFAGPTLLRPVLLFRIGLAVFVHIVEVTRITLNPHANVGIRGDAALGQAVDRRCLNATDEWVRGLAGIIRAT